MQYYFAPLEGLTDRIFREAHHRHFPGIHKYYTPFLSPTVHRSLTPKEIRELPEADTLEYTAVPQLLTKSAEDFLWMAAQCAQRGYREVNLNLGCPSGTVTAKGKGSGMLADPEGLRQFLDCIFYNAPVDISVKTRLGLHSKEEFPNLLEIFNQFPIKELTVHPRIRDAFYKGSPDLSCFSLAVAQSRCPVCFNGNLCSADEIRHLQDRFPSVRSVMLGRGLIADPGMLSPGGTDRQTLEAFHTDLLEHYLEAFGGSRNAMFRLKEHWYYLICKFEGGEKLYKRLRKTTDLEEYRAITAEIFRSLPLRSTITPTW